MHIPCCHSIDEDPSFIRMRWLSPDTIWIRLEQPSLLPPTIQQGCEPLISGHKTDDIDQIQDGQQNERQGDEREQKQNLRNYEESVQAESP